MDYTYTVSELFKEIKYRGQKNYRLNNILIFFLPRILIKPAFVEEKTSLKQNKNLFNLVEK